MPEKDCVSMSEVKRKSVPDSTRTESSVIEKIEKKDFTQNHYITPDSNISRVFTSDSNTGQVIIEHADVEPVTKIYKELKKKFEPKKRSTFPLSACYTRIGEDNRAARVLDCGTFLEFAREIDSEKCKLQNANFCRDRLCPLCSWRRSYKIFGQVSRIMDNIENDFDFVFLTLTIPNVRSHCLPAKIDQMQKAFKQLMQFDKRIKRACAGYFKALEVTHNKNRYSKSFDTYHPHFHVILAMDKGYCKSDNYIKQSEFLDMWRRVMHDNSITQVDVRMCKNKSSSECLEAEQSISSAVAEVAKYAVKSNDYIIPWSEPLTDSSVRAFLSALSGRRLCSFGGIFNQVRKALQFDDAENGDLVHVESEKLRSDVALQIYRYAWSAGAYKLIAVEKKCSPLIDASEDDF